MKTEKASGNMAASSGIYVGFVPSELTRDGRFICLSMGHPNFQGRPSLLVYLLLILFLVFASQLAMATDQSGEPASRHPFKYYKIANTTDGLIETVFSGDQGAALQKSVENRNIYYHSLPGCRGLRSVANAYDMGTFSPIFSGLYYAGLDAFITEVQGGKYSCYGVDPGTYEAKGSLVSGYCNSHEPYADDFVGLDEACYCQRGQLWRADIGRCMPYRDRYFGKPKDESCPAKNLGVGNPIYPLTGSKRQEVDLGVWVGGQALTLSYDTAGKVPEAAGNATMVVPPPDSFGPMWQTNMHKSLVLQSSGGPGAAFSTVAMQRGASMWATASVAGFDSCTPGASGGGGACVRSHR